MHRNGEKIKRRLKLKVEKASGKDIKKLGVFFKRPHRRAYTNIFICGVGYLLYN